MRTVASIAELRASLRAHRGSDSIGLVPTMGAFHDGHLALMRAARAENDVAVVSLFVNPTQFGAGEDLTRYPRNLARDGALAADAEVDLLFTPSLEEMYPDGFQTWVEVAELARGLENDARPGHFRAVATVCLKLFHIVQPDRAYFGEKDVQQLAVLERMVRDLDVPLEIRAVPTVRDEDGLALSSRNVYLSPQARAAALVLPRALDAGRDAHRSGDHADAVARSLLLGARSDGVETDYCQLARLDDRLVLAAAIRIGDTRLIDNVILAGAPT